MHICTLRMSVTEKLTGSCWHMFTIVLEACDRLDSTSKNSWTLRARFSTRGICKLDDGKRRDDSKRPLKS
jgi:hypothetical protein